MSIILGHCLGRFGLQAAIGPAARRECLRQLSSTARHLHKNRIRTYASPIHALIPTNATNNALHQHLHRSRRIGGIRTFFGGRVITEYVDIPPDYQDEVGLRFRKKDLQGHEVVAIFGSSLDTERANRLLRIIHGRRVAGTLHDPAYFPNTRQFQDDHIEKAIAYLRKEVPVDETINAGLRAEEELEELQRLEEEEADGAAGEERPRPMGKDTDKPSPTVETWTRRLFKERPMDDPYGESAIDRIRADREAQWEEELKRREAEQALKEAEEAAKNLGGLAKLETNPRLPSPRMQKWIKAATSDLKEPPKMSSFARLWKSYAFVFSVIFGMSIFGNYVYEPPTREERIFPDTDPAYAMAGALVGAVITVYCWWKTPAMWPLMNRYFILTSATPRVAALFGSIFSHQQLSHLAVNAPALFIFAQALESDAGRSEMLQTLLSGGSIGFLASITHMVLRGRLRMSTLGVSGAIYALGGAYFWMYKFDGFKIFELPPDPYNGIQGLGFIGLAVGGHIWAGLRKGISQVDLVSHMAGLAVGIIYGEWFSMRNRERAAAFREGREERGLWELLGERISGEAKPPVKEEAKPPAKE